MMWMGKIVARLCESHSVTPEALVRLVEDVAGADTVMIEDALAELANALVKSSNGMLYYKIWGKTLEYLDKAADKRKKARRCMEMAVSHLDRDERGSAVAYYEDALWIFHELGDEESQRECCQLIEDIYQVEPSLWWDDDLF